MIYVTVKASQRFHQMTIEELLYGINVNVAPVAGGPTDTKTYEIDSVNGSFLSGFSAQNLIRRLEKFNEFAAPLRAVDRHSLYRSFAIPKRSGGLRHIDAPNDDLMTALRMLKNLFETDFHECQQTRVRTTYYHTSAFAYIKGRCAVDAVKKHQANESRWFAKLDFKDFFGSTTIEHTMHMLSMIYPFSEICRNEHGYEELYKAVELGFLDGVLPQGTPLSPLLTNIIMVPIDYKLSNILRDYNGKRFVYTRYADDTIISSRYDFDVRQIEGLILSVLKEFNAPYVIKREKTRYGSSSGSNWNLGVMLNKENKITIGYKKKKIFKAMLSSYAMDRKNGSRWSLEDIQHMEGLRSYYRSIEKESIDEIVKHLSQKFGVDIIAVIKDDLRTI